MIIQVSLYNRYILYLIHSFELYFLKEWVLGGFLNFISSPLFKAD
jgi:hypothetical protein